MTRIDKVLILTALTSFSLALATAITAGVFIWAEGWA